MASFYSTLHQYPCSLQTLHPSFIVPSFQIYIHNIPFSFDMTSSNLYEQNMATGTGSPCGACKFLRRRCASDCVFAPYFSCDQGAARFAAIHKVFGASNVSKLLMHLPVADRCEAVVTIAYEAQARIKDQVYGCVAQIFALQQQVAILQAQVMQTKAQIAYGLLEVQSSQRNQNISEKTVPVGCTKRPHYSTDYYTNEGALMQETGFKDEILSNQLVQCNKRFAGHNEIGDLQSLAFTMMNSSQS